MFSFLSVQTEAIVFVVGVTFLLGYALWVGNGNRPDDRPRRKARGLSGPRRWRVTASSRFAFRLQEGQ